eukprot:GILK01010814.1.p1 GENE.GILK01010814.1~~GILK01010814.1.p1  ORF type:complete len:271 (+),score=31.10 GILK01010814.1:63-875(+)
MVKYDPLKEVSTDPDDENRSIRRGNTLSVYGYDQLPHGRESSPHFLMPQAPHVVSFNPTLRMPNLIVVNKQMSRKREELEKWLTHVKTCSFLGVIFASFGVAFGIPISPISNLDIFLYSLHLFLSIVGVHAALKLDRRSAFLYYRGMEALLIIASICGFTRLVIDDNISFLLDLLMFALAVVIWGFFFKCAQRFYKALQDVIHEDEAALKIKKRYKIPPIMHISTGPDATSGRIEWPEPKPHAVRAVEVVRAAAASIQVEPAELKEEVPP